MPFTKDVGNMERVFIQVELLRGHFGQFAIKRAAEIVDEEIICLSTFYLKLSNLYNIAGESDVLNFVFQHRLWVSDLLRGFELF